MGETFFGFNHKKTTTATKMFSQVVKNNIFREYNDETRR